MREKQRFEMKIALLNTTILTGGSGTYRQSEPMTLPEVREWVNVNAVSPHNGANVTSYIGHESTASIMSTLLEFPVAVNRGQFKQNTETVALCFKLNGRPEEGKILSVDEINAIGYEWFTITKID